MAEANQFQPALVNGVDPLDEPSVHWGWHRHFRKLRQITGWIVAAFLVFMGFVGNHVGHVEVIWSLLFAGLIAAGLIYDLLRGDDIAARQRADEKRIQDAAVAQTGRGGALLLAQRDRDRRRGTKELSPAGEGWPVSSL